MNSTYVEPVLNLEIWSYSLIPTGKSFHSASYGGG
ncbi:protein of unknown function [Nitrospira japonica]|uniref:Uncharacterized protein n=1 Tax=Nitrospira japonica TaxID=1325564 RepID=A0A1W1I0E7_9BACT|nr:protein of unknown function [Nitrospira japonica]